MTIMIPRNPQRQWTLRPLTVFLFLSVVLLQHYCQAKKSSPSFSISSLPKSLEDVKQLLQDRMEKAKELAKLEQSVDDVNAQWIAAATSRGQAASYRRLIAMPLTEVFDPSVGFFSRGHVQTGDKMSLPRVFWDAIKLNEAEVPWLYQVSRVEGVTSPRVESPVSSDDTSNSDTEDAEASKKKKKKKRQLRPADLGAARSLERLDSVVGGPLDFRAPPNYIFLPWWMMRALGLKPRDVVDVRQVLNIPAGSKVRFRPLTEQTLKDMANPHAVLETELRHYSSLTKGSTIGFDYNKKRYWFEVADCRSGPINEKKAMIKCQDCDVSTEFLPARETVLAKKKNKIIAPEKE